jgi:hypothetical protein
MDANERTAKAISELAKAKVREEHEQHHQYAFSKAVKHLPLSKPDAGLKETL